jgi:hypothetical protein
MSWFNRKKNFDQLLGKDHVYLTKGRWLVFVNRVKRFWTISFTITLFFAILSALFNYLYLALALIVLDLAMLISFYIALSLLKRQFYSLVASRISNKLTEEEKRKLRLLYGSIKVISKEHYITGKHEYNQEILLMNLAITKNIFYLNGINKEAMYLELDKLYLKEHQIDKRYFRERQYEYSRRISNDSDDLRPVFAQVAKPPANFVFFYGQRVNIADRMSELGLIKKKYEY